MLVRSFSGICVAQSSVFSVFVIFCQPLNMSFCFAIPVYLYHILLMKYYIDPLRLITNKL
jgi:hypothetical protein